MKLTRNLMKLKRRCLCGLHQMNLSDQCLTDGFHANAIERQDGSANSHELQNDHMDVK